MVVSPIAKQQTAVWELFDISKLNNQSAVTTALLSKPPLPPHSPIISASSNSVVPVLRGKRVLDYITSYYWSFNTIQIQECSFLCLPTVLFISEN